MKKRLLKVFITLTLGIVAEGIFYSIYKHVNSICLVTYLLGVMELISIFGCIILIEAIPKDESEDLSDNN